MEYKCKYCGSDNIEDVVYEYEDDEKEVRQKGLIERCSDSILSLIFFPFILMFYIIVYIIPFLVKWALKGLRFFIWLSYMAFFGFWRNLYRKAKNLPAKYEPKWIFFLYSLGQPSLDFYCHDCGKITKISFYKRLLEEREKNEREEFIDWWDNRREKNKA